MAERVSSLLRRSVEHLAVEVPASYHLLLERLGPLSVDLDVDGELFSLSGGSEIVVTDGPAPDAGVQIATSRDGILAVVDATVGLAEAVEQGTVAVRGSLDDVLRVHDTLHAYVHAAVRAPSQPGLLHLLRVTS